MHKSTSTNGSNDHVPTSVADTAPVRASAKREPEAPEIESLLMTHRARIPIALTVAQDYSGVPFRVPRPFIALGWFWIVDAWVSSFNSFPHLE